MTTQTIDSTDRRNDLYRRRNAARKKLWEDERRAQERHIAAGEAGEGYEERRKAFCAAMDKARHDFDAAVAQIDAEEKTIAEEANNAEMQRRFHRDQQRQQLQIRLQILRVVAVPPAPANPNDDPSIAKLRETWYQLADDTRTQCRELERAGRYHDADDLRMVVRKKVYAALKRYEDAVASALEQQRKAQAAAQAAAVVEGVAREREIAELEEGLRRI